MENFIKQYKISFLLPWIICYFLYPSWVLPLSFTGKLLVFISLIVYFSFSAYVMNSWFKKIPVSKPLFIHNNGWLNTVKKDPWFSAVCCIAVMLNILRISSPIMMVGDESLHLTGGVWMYRYVSNNLHIYLQYISWAFLVSLFLMIRQRSVRGAIVKSYSEYSSKRLPRVPLIVLFILLLCGYFLLYQNLPYHPNVVRYPPLSRLLYSAVYLFMGINHIGPRVLQLFFYLLSAVYLYRTINLFSSRESALLGASIYLFLPVVFFYAHTAELANGTNFFIIIISFFFLRYIKEGEKRDLLLIPLFISIGFLYKRIILLMLFICAAYLIVCWFTGKGRDFNLGNSVKALLISLVPIIPWMIIGRFFSWRNYDIIWSNLLSFDRHEAYLLLIPKNISWIIFSLLLAAVIIILKNRRSHLSSYFGFLFIVFYLFLVADKVNESARLSMAFYPAIVIFLSQLVTVLVDKIRWKHSFKLIFILLLSYFVSISSFSPFNIRHYHEEKLKLEYFPSQDAFEWVRDNIKKERVLTLRIFPSRFYTDKFGISRDMIIDLWFELGEVSSPDKLRSYCAKHEISYIMFPYGPIYSRAIVRDVLTYLKENPGNEFEEAASFNLGENFIYIYRLI